MLVLRSTHAALQADYERVLEQRDEARRAARAAQAATHLAAGQFTDTDDALGRARLSRITDAVAYRRRITRLRRAIATYRAALTTETRRADRLQAAYDHAVGLDHRVQPGCDYPGCVAPDHVEDQPMRDQLKTQMTSIFGGAL